MNKYIKYLKIGILILIGPVILIFTIALLMIVNSHKDLKTLSENSAKAGNYDQIRNYTKQEDSALKGTLHTNNNNLANNQAIETNNPEKNSITTETQEKDNEAQGHNQPDDSLSKIADSRYFNADGSRKIESEMETTSKHEMIDIKDTYDTGAVKPAKDPGDLPLMVEDENITIDRYTQLTDVPDHIKIGNRQDWTDLVFFKQGKQVGAVSLHNKYSLDNLTGLGLSVDYNYLCLSPYYGLNINDLKNKKLTFEQISCNSSTIYQFADKLAHYEFDDPNYEGLVIPYLK